MNIKILSYNVHKGVGWVGRRSTLEEIRTQIRDRHPNVIFLQEILGSQFEYLAEELWPHFVYGKNAVYASGHHGNAVLSKYPVLHWDNLDLSAGRYEKRGLLHAAVNLKESSILHLLCVHLGLFKRDRSKQLKKIVSYIQKNIPAQDALILAGDFNDWSGHATEPLIHGLELEEAFLQCHGAYAKTFPAWQPFLRLDRLYFRGLKAHHAIRLMNKDWRQLSDHIALEAFLTLLF